MRWLLKAISQKTLSAMPNSEKFNYFFQHNVVKSLPGSDEVFLRKFSTVLKHWALFLKHTSLDEPAKGVFYEFGAGQDFETPLSYCAFGIKKQIIIDICPKMRIDLVNGTIGRFLKNKEKLQQIAGRTLYIDNFRMLQKKEDLLTYFGINYIAPCDARNTQFSANSFDFISSTAVFEHVPSLDIPQILKESRRILRPGGIMSCIIDMRDHYSYFDKSISVYNFLKFPDRIWNFVNSSLHYQNRLRYPDYIGPIEAASFTILEQEIVRPSSDETERLKSIKLAMKFKKYSFEDLGIKEAHILCRKQ